MPRDLRAQRYAEGASPSLIWMIKEKLPFLSFAEAMEFYREWVPRLSPKELALLGCNDRYFLLTGLLNRPDMMHPWRYDRAREVEAAPDGHIDLWFREAGKSSIITFAGSIQEILSDPELTIGIFGNTKDISRPFLKQIKDELEANDELKAVYADVLWENPRQDAPSWALDGGIVVKRRGNPKEATIEAHGVIDAMPTGRHFGLMIFNDVITEKNVTNPEMIKKSAERFELADNLGKAEGSRKWIEGTRYSYADYYGEMIKKGIAKPRIYPATDDGTLDGTPVLLSPEAWERKKRAQRSTIAAQMLQNPMAGNENTFRVQWLKPYWVRPAMMNIYIMGDPSQGRSKSSDRTAIPVVGIDTGGNKYLVDGYCHRMPLSERWARLRELHKKWTNMPGVQLVKVGWEKYGMQTDIEYFEERMRLEGPRFEIIELNWTGEAGQQAKPKRVARLEPDFRNGNFFLPARVWAKIDETSLEARWSVAEGRDEIQYRPNPGPHAEERRVRGNGEHWRITEPIRRLDEDKNIYDLTEVFFEEYRFFPFASRDDLIDAASRIYDMDPMPAVRHQVVEVEDFVDS